MKTEGRYILTILGLGFMVGIFISELIDSIWEMSDLEPVGILVVLIMSLSFIATGPTYSEYRDDWKKRIS